MGREEVIRFPRGEMTAATGAPPAAGDGYRFYQGALWHGAERLGRRVRAHVSGGETMVVTIERDNDPDAPKQFFEVEDSARRWWTCVVRAVNAERAIALAAEHVEREYGEPGEMTATLLDPIGPEGVVIDDPS